MTFSVPAGLAALEQPHTILIVDDQPTNLSVLADHLVAHGFTVLVAEDGESGLERAIYTQPDLIILDVMLPGMDGIETCRRLKVDERTCTIPVLFMTVAISMEDKLRGFAAGGVDYLSKPVQQAELLARVAVHLRVQEQHKHVQQQAAILARANQQLVAEIRERQRIEETLQQERDLSQALAGATALLNQTLDPEDVLARLLELIGQAFPHDTITILLIGPEHQVLLARGRKSPHFGMESSIAIPGYDIDQVPNLRRMVETRAPVLIADTTADPEWVHTPESTWLRAYVGAPICARGAVIGFLNVNSATPNIFTPLHASVLRTFADHAAIALENARLYQAAQRELVERTQIEAALRQSEERFAAVMNSMQMVIYVADMETHELLFVNAYTRALYHAREGQRCWEAIQAGQTGECPFCTNAHLMKNGFPTGTYTWEFQNTRTGRWYYLQDQAIRWTDGRWVRLEIATDITELKQVQADLQQAKIAAEAADRAKSIFLTHMSHELRTPLNAILGFTQLLAEAANLTHEQREDLKMMQRNGDRLLTLINAALRMSELDEEPATAQVAPVADATPVQLITLPEWIALTAAVRRLPAAWQTELQQAATQGDMEWLLALVDQVAAREVRLTAHLRAWINTFSYTQILELITRSQEETDERR